jgi:hypothetical protein
MGYHHDLRRYTTLVSPVALFAALMGCGSETSDPEPGDGTGAIDLLRVGTPRDGLIGWNIVSPSFEQPNDADVLSFEWDYFMVHDAKGAFTGSVGYLFANPRNAGEGGLGDLVPKGGNVAIAGRFDDGVQVADYRNFGLGASSISSMERSFDAQVGEEFGRMTPQRGQQGEADRLLLEGKTDEFSWELTVTQDWPALSSSDHVFAPEGSDDVGAMMPGENWNVNMLWPRTKVSGVITRRVGGEQVSVEGHGYRENSWGRWAFNLGGWDFAVVSDEAAGVSWAWQTYHKKSTNLDYLDVGFVDGGAVVLEQFRMSEGQLGWKHPSWAFDSVARQCTPVSTVVVGQNERYRVEANLDLRGRQVPMLSDATSATKQYVIMIQFPMVEGVILRRADGGVVATFSGQGGGEFSTSRSTRESMTDEECVAWGEEYAAPMPE